MRSIVISVPGMDTITFELKKEGLVERKEAVRRARALHVAATSIVKEQDDQQNFKLDDDDMDICGCSPDLGFPDQDSLCNSTFLDLMADQFALF